MSEAIRTTCKCGQELLAVLPDKNPTRRDRTPMVAWSYYGETIRACPNCKRTLPRISVPRFKDSAGGVEEIMQT